MQETVWVIQAGTQVSKLPHQERFFEMIILTVCLPAREWNITVLYHKTHLKISKMDIVQTYSKNGTYWQAGRQANHHLGKPPITLLHNKRFCCQISKTDFFSEGHVWKTGTMHLAHVVKCILQECCHLLFWPAVLPPPRGGAERSLCLWFWPSGKMRMICRINENHYK